MKVIYSPQVPHIPVEADYRAEGDKLIVTLNGVTEEFDFTEMSDGQLETLSVDDLPLNPILDAVKKDGELTVTLASYVGRKPIREVIGYDDEGEEILESEESFQARWDEWEESKKCRNGTL